MNVLIVYAHPEEKSFNGAMKDTAIDVLQHNGHQVKVSDLYSIKFKAVADQDDFTELANPEHFNYLFEQKIAAEKGTFVKDILEEQAKLTWADTLIFQFPLWWTEPPAILKGWFDRVFAKGFAYNSGATYEKGLLRGKKAMLAFTTSGGPDIYGKDQLKGDMHQRLFNLHHEKLFYCGFSLLEPFIAWRVDQGDKARKAYIKDYANRLQRLTEEAPISPKESWVAETLI